MLGEYLDPVADKLLLSTLFLVLMHMALIPVHGDGAGLWQGCGHSGGGGNSVCGHGAAGVHAQPAGQGQYAGAGGGCGCRAACHAAQRMVALDWVALFEVWALDATMALTVASGLHYAWIAARRVGAPAANGHSGK